MLPRRWSCGDYPWAPLWGIALAAERSVRRLIVEGGFSSAAAIAQLRYPLFPVRWCLRDKFDRLIARVSASILLVHGERDGWCRLPRPNGCLIALFRESIW
jgi:hypothetical protein